MIERKILVVDDEQAILRLFSRAFTKQGYEVQTAESGESALEIVNETPYWVCFLDLNLPGISGIKLCSEIRKRYPMAITIAVTGYASLYEFAACRDAGFEDYFTKPVDLASLFAAAEHAFHKLDRWESSGDTLDIRK